MATPWMTSNDLIESVKRKISFPTSQNTFSDEDILRFANEEMAIEQVPAIMQVHEEYFVVTQQVNITSNKSRYDIPDRAIGSKLRDLFFVTNDNSLFEMTRINSEDKAYYQANLSINSTIHKFYLQGNEVVLTPTVGSTASGSLYFGYFLRPNQLVKNDRAAKIQGFSKEVTIDNSNIVPNDTITVDDVVFTAVSGAPSGNQFQIGGTSIVTATNFVTALVAAGVTASNGSPATAIVTISTDNILMEVSSSNQSGASVSDNIIINTDAVPSNITQGSLVDFIQEKPGHKIRAINVKIPSGSISGNNISFPSSAIQVIVTNQNITPSIVENKVPYELSVGDYICSVNETIVPQIPTDLHTILADRTAARILSAIGDREALAELSSKIQRNEQKAETMLDNRVEGAPQKLTSRHSILRYSKMGPRRRI